MKERNGYLLWYCHAGCSQQDVEEALRKKGLLSDWTSSRTSRHKTPEAVYTYVDEHGKTLFEVCRFPGKKFRQRRPDGAGGWIYHLGETPRVLYRLPEVLAAVKEGRTIYVDFNPS